jgi:hypothetical protein
MTILIQKADLALTSFGNDDTAAAQGISIRTDAGSAVGVAIASAALTGTKPTSMTHAWDISGDGSGTLTLTFPDLSTISCTLSALPSPVTC